MDPSRFSLSSQELYGRLGTARAPMIIDVRKPSAFDEDDRILAGAVRRAPGEVHYWAPSLSCDRPTIVYCARGHEVSQNVAAALRASGIEACFLEGGIAAWTQHGFPTRKRAPAADKWVTRARPKIDRIACPWLIRRFVDPDAEFLYVESRDVFTTAAQTGAVAYDMVGSEPFAHEGEFCTFDAMIKVFELHDSALDTLARIVRGADTGVAALTAQSAGLLAISWGLSANFANDDAMLEQGMVVYDALYAWCRSARSEAHR